MSKDTNITSLPNIPPVKILLLAPIRKGGGIATWLRVLQQWTHSKRIHYRIINTARQDRILGQREKLSDQIKAAFTMGVGRTWRLIYASIFFRPSLAYFTCAPSVGLALRDCPYVLLLRLIGIKSVLHLHGGDPNGFFGKNSFSRWWIRFVMKKCRAIIVITREIESHTKARIAEEKVFYMPNMLDDEFCNNVHGTYQTRSHSPCTAPHRLLHVAFQAPSKGTLDIINALALVKSPFICHLVGEIASEHELHFRQLLKQHDLENKIFIEGKKFGDELFSYHSQADLFLFPSHGEGFPLAILEAMAFGLPILASDVGAIREMLGIDTTTPSGWLLEHKKPVNTIELSEKIDYLLTHPEIRMKHSKNGPARLKKQYLASSVVPKLEHLLQILAYEHK